MGNTMASNEYALTSSVFTVVVIYQNLTFLQSPDFSNSLYSSLFCQLVRDVLVFVNICGLY